MEKKLVIEKALEKKAYEKWRQLENVFNKVYKIMGWIVKIILIATVIKVVYGNHITGEHIEIGFLNIFGRFMLLSTIVCIMRMFMEGFGLLEIVKEIKRTLPFVSGVVLLILLHFTAVFINYENYGYVSFRGSIWWYLFTPIAVLFKVTILMMIISLITKIVCIIIDYRNQDYAFVDFYRIYTGNFDDNFFKNLKLKKKFRK